MEIWQDTAEMLKMSLNGNAFAQCTVAHYPLLLIFVKKPSISISKLFRVQAR